MVATRPEPRATGRGHGRGLMREWVHRWPILHGDPGHSRLTPLVRLARRRWSILSDVASIAGEESPAPPHRPRARVERAAPQWSSAGPAIVPLTCGNGEIWS